MKGIILAGGKNTRLKPLTNAITKQLLPIYNKPMIFYPLSTLMLAGIKDILIISNPGDIELIKKLLGKGLQLGINISYQLQKKPEGIAQALKIGKKFIDNKPVTLILGDNLFFGSNLGFNIKNAIKKNKGATIFAYNVYDPSMYGVVKLSKNGKPLSIIEKPKRFISNYAITGLYFFDNKVVKYSKNLKPSKRGELEIVDLLNKYRKRNKLSAEFIGRGGAWLDTGTIEDYYKTSAFVQAIENRQGLKIACLEEISYLNKWIKKKEILRQIKFYGKCSYSNYLRKIINHSV